MRFVAIDPGPDVSAFAIVEPVDAKTSRARFIDGGLFDSTHESIESFLKAHAGAQLAVEVIAGYVHEHARGAQLLLTSAIAERIVTIARTLGFTPTTMPAAEWRGIFAGSRVASDPRVRKACELWVANMPKLPARTILATKKVSSVHVHVRDATGFAVAAMWVAERNAALARAKGLR